jgi:phosphoribosylformimino-5-aminoimidazole carboxamide ribotide isomerase
MIVLPAVDLREGACVQLVGGAYADERVRIDDPLAAAREWARLGFRRLHVVDLDAATGVGSNAAVVEELVRHGGFDAVQVGGGVRGREAVQRVLDLGAAAAVIGTRGLEDPEWLAEAAAEFPGALVLAADVRGRHVVTRGWAHALPRTIDDVLEDVAGLPLAALMVTAGAPGGADGGRGPAADGGRGGGRHGARVRVGRGGRHAGPAQPRRPRRGGRGGGDGPLHRRARRAPRGRRVRGGTTMPDTRRRPPPGAAPAGTTVVRETRETQIRVRVARGTGAADVDTSEPFLDHMLTRSRATRGSTSRCTRAATSSTT